jgi:hypothetical protein
LTRRAFALPERASDAAAENDEMRIEDVYGKLSRKGREKDRRGRINEAPGPR